MRSAGQVVARVFELVRDMLRPGITTLQIDSRVEEFIRGEGGKPSFKGYGGFPGSVCASVNEQIVHGIPDDRPLEEGDLLTIDVGVIQKGYHADAARSYAVVSV
jgi:methionyl aminopeptidase